MEEKSPARYVNPFTDFGFKKLFGEEASKDLLIDFLNALLPQAGSITDVTYLSNEHLGRSATDRRSVFDIYCINQAGERFIVEMQKAKQQFFKERSLFYATFPIREQAQRGQQWEFELKAIYTVGILDFVFDEDLDSDEYYHHHVVLVDQMTNKVFYDKLTFVYLEMPKFNKTEAELETKFDKWMYVLKNLVRLQRCPVRLQEKIFAKLFDVAELAAFTHLEWEEYEYSLKSYRDWINVTNYAVNTGVKKGIAEAVAEMEKAKAEMNKVKSEKDQALVEKDQALVEKDDALVEKERALMEKNNALAEKRRTLVQAVELLNKAGVDPAVIATNLGLEPSMVAEILVNHG